jgi:saccharopine dehydrogenase-like NADP-dependent oxidoreductase
LLILGASGNVARAFLRRLGGRRTHFGKLVLLDKTDHVRHDHYLEHRRRHYRFVRHRLQSPHARAYYRQLLRRHQIDIVLDLTDADTLPILKATDAAGVSYVCTSLNDTKQDAVELVDAVHPAYQRRSKAPHILCSGMNPGVVNAWVQHAVRGFGVPREIVHFEYDTSMAADRWRPVITWSPKEFLTEAVWERTGAVVDGVPLLKPTNALHHRIDLGPIMKPVMALPSYPRGFLILHEENLTIGRALRTSSKFN